MKVSELAVGDPFRVSGARVSQFSCLMRQQARLMLAQKEPLVLLFVVPVIAAAFTRELFAPLLATEGHPGADGSLQSVPGMAVFFALYIPTFLSVALFSEHVWGTWSRVRVLSLSHSVQLFGQMFAWIVVGIMQQALVFGCGVIWFRFPAARVSYLVLPGVLFIVCCTAIGMLVYVFCNSIGQISGLSNILSVVMGGSAGALVPLSLLPHVVAWVGRAFPPYWTMRAYQYVAFGGDIGRQYVLPVVVLSIFAAFLSVGAAVAFRRDMRKQQ